MNRKTKDPARRNWEKDDWREYEEENQRFSKDFRNALRNKFWFKVEQLLEQAKSSPNYYIFPDIEDLKEGLSAGMLLHINGYKKYFYEDPP